MFVIDVMSRVPVYEQIINQVEEQILTGLLNSGDKMPSVRSLSVSLSINPNTIQKAYTELDRKKLIVTVPGKGSFISQEALDILGASSREKMPEFKQAVRELALAGITKDELIQAGCIHNKMRRSFNDKSRRYTQNFRGFYRPR